MEKPEQSIFCLGDETDINFITEKRTFYMIHEAEEQSTDCQAQRETEAQMSQIGLLTQH